ncbi:MAG: lysophospholipid acyltransferase family protein [Acidobacteriaceae bacterium]
MSSPSHAKAQIAGPGAALTTIKHVSDRDRQGFTFGQRVALWIVPKLTALILAVIGLTLRFDVIAEEGAVPASPPARGIFCFWHRCTLPAGWYFRKFRCSILISRSFDGELIARTLGLLGYGTVRGSSSRGGAAGLIAMRDVLESGLPVVFTADGPRGPIYQTKIGPVKLAAMSVEAIGSFYLLPQRAWAMPSWDQFLVPKPFSRVVVSWARSLPAPPADADAAALESARQELNAALERARLRAEAYFAKSHNP